MWEGLVGFYMVVLWYAGDLVSWDGLQFTLQPLKVQLVEFSDI